jgi:CheY-like chemotaxis protein
MPETKIAASGHAPPHQGLRVLVADDDPTTLQFCRAALESLGCLVTACLSREETLREATAHRFNLLLLDCRMPGGGAASIMQALLRDPEAASARAPAIATTAGADAATRQHMRELGFVELLGKPFEVAQLRALLNRFGRHPALILDDAEAIASSGDASITRALRSLLLDELNQLAKEFDALVLDTTAFADLLHRLRSACGFCGAMQLQHLTIDLQRMIRAGHAPGHDDLEAFRRALLTTIAALKREGDAQG